MQLPLRRTQSSRPGACLAMCSSDLCTASTVVYEAGSTYVCQYQRLMLMRNCIGLIALGVKPESKTKRRPHGRLRMESIVYLRIRSRRK